MTQTNISKETLENVYRHLTMEMRSAEKYPSQADVAKELNINRSSVCRIAKALEIGGWIVKGSPKVRPYCYFATKKPFDIDLAMNVYKDYRNGLVDPVSPRQQSLAYSDTKKIRVCGKSQFEWVVVRRELKEIKWRRVKGLKNMTRYSFEEYFIDHGIIKYHLNVYKNSTRLVIYLPRFTFPSNPKKAFEYTMEMAKQIGNRFQRKYKIDLKNMRCIRKPDFGRPVHTEKGVLAAQQGTFSGKVKIDSSPQPGLPNGIAMIETSDTDLAYELEECPDRIKRLEEIQNANQEKTELIFNNQKYVKFKLNELSFHLQKIESLLSNDRRSIPDNN